MADLKDLDKESEKGRFGWTVVDACGIPYIFRPDGKYCALRMLEYVRFYKMPSYIKKELFSCTSTKYKLATKLESKLLNAINSNHCNYQYGLEQFDTTELLMDISHAVETCRFLRNCCNKLKKNCEFDISNLCGFTRINKSSVVPYSVQNGKKCVPLFYFEGEMDGLEKCAVVMNGWDLSYLKFCCKIQGVNNALLKDESYLVVSLENLKGFFPQTTSFEEFWPQKAAQNIGSSNVSTTLATLFCFNENVSNQTMNSVNDKTNNLVPNKYSVTKNVNDSNVNVSESNVVSYKRNAYYVGPFHKYSLYSLQKININNRMINSINMKPNDMYDKWVTLEDLSRVFFFNVPVVICKQVLHALEIEMRKANSWQNVILQNSGPYRNKDILTLVPVEPVIKYWLQINFMLKNISTKQLKTTNE